MSKIIIKYMTNSKVIRHTDLSTNSVKLYMSELTTNKIFKPLDINEERYLFEQYYLNNCINIKNRIISSNMKWVITQAKMYLSYSNGTKATLEDLISEGNIGLIIAFNSYNINKGVRFLSYAQHYIKREIVNYLNNTLIDIPQPANRYIIDRNVKKSLEHLNIHGISNPSLEQIVDMYNIIKMPQHNIITTNLLAKIQQDKLPFVSSSKNINDSDDSIIEDYFTADKSYTADILVNIQNVKDNTIKLLSNILKPNEFDVIIHTYGILDNEEKTLEQIANITDYTRERVGQLLKIALIKLKNHKCKFSDIIS